MQRSIRLLSLTAMFLTAPAAAQAQLTVQGRVTGDNGEPLAGARISVPGTPLETVSGGDGTYRLVIAAPGAQTVVQVRFLGYKSQRRTIAQSSGSVTADFELVRDVLLLDQVVVTGTAASTERGALGNSIATVNAGDIANTGAQQLDAALTGKVPGALIQQTSGTPGGGTSVRIRGTSTINRSAEPLYIVDGVIIDNGSSQLINLGGYTSNRVADLDANDVERVEIVKGAAAAALYGSRANDGVVQIFTKRGVPGRLRITYRNTIGLDEVETRLAVNESPVDAAGNPVTRYDYQDDIFQRGVTYNTSLALSGGDDATQYYVAGSYQNQEGIVKGSDYRKTSVRVNLDRTLFDWLALSTNFNYIHSNASLVPNAGLTGLFGVLTNFLFTPNSYELFPDPVTGEYPRGFLFANPLETIANWQAPQTIDRFLGGFQLRAFPIEGLSVNYRFGFDAYTQDAEQFVPRNSSAPALAPGLAISAIQRAHLLNSDVDVNYAFDASPTVRLTTAVGLNYQEQNFDVVTARAEDLALLTQTVQGSQQFATQVIDERRSIGFYGQETVAIGETLYLTGAIRSDASSTFGAEERQQFFPKASVSFEPSNLQFWRETFGSGIGRFRVRAALGYSGGQPAGSFERFSNYVFEPNSGRSGVVNSTQQGNEFLKPERMREIEIGGDFEFANGRVGLEVSYYDQQTQDLILPKTVTPSTGFTQQLANVGELSNKGWEFLVRSLNVRTPSVTWSTTLTLSTNDPLIDRLSDGGAFFIPESFNVIRVDAGEPPGHFFGTTYVRDAAGNILDNAGNPVQDASGNIVGVPAIGPREIIGDPNPDVMWSLINELGLGEHITVRVQLDAVTGHDLFNFDRRLLETPAFGAGKEYERELRGEVPVGFFQARRSIFEEYMENGSFMKLREVSAQYTLRSGIVSRLGLRSVQLSVIGRNLFTVTDYTGWDPESNAGAQRTLVRGFGFATIPIPRSMMFGVTLNY